MNEQEKTTVKKPWVKKYWPLLALIIITALAASALNYRAGSGWMHFFMGIFLCVFAMLKSFRLSDFVDAFQMYDLVARKSKTYAYLYPLIELALGLCYLAFVIPPVIYIATIVILGIGAIGVIKALKNGLDVRCACMGTALDVPLSTVTLTEDIAMIAMALILLL